MQERDGLAKQLADAITITIQISPGSRSEVGAALGASEDKDRLSTYTKFEADYRRAKPNAEKVCGNCEFFTHDSCEIVSGVIDEKDVCNYWSGNGDVDGNENLDAD